MTYAAAVMDSDDHTAYEFLKKHWDEVAYVDLTYSWTSYAKIDLDGWHAEYFFETYPDVAAMFFVKELDEEYSFSGTAEDALKFFENYCIWDGNLRESDIVNGVLCAKYNNDVKTLDDADDFEPSNFYLEVRSCGLYFHSEKKWTRKIPGVRFIRDDPEEDQEDSE